MEYKIEHAEPDKNGHYHLHRDAKIIGMVRNVLIVLSPVPRGK